MSVLLVRVYCPKRLLVHVLIFSQTYKWCLIIWKSRSNCVYSSGFVFSLCADLQRTSPNFARLIKPMNLTSESYFRFHCVCTSSRTKYRTPFIMVVKSRFLISKNFNFIISLNELNIANRAQIFARFRNSTPVISTKIRSLL